MSRNDRSTFDAAALLDLAERSWAPRLRGARTARESDADPELAGAVAVALGAVYRGADVRERRELARRWPACVVVGLTAVAAAPGVQDRFWPHWWAACRIRGTARDATAWGEMFLAALRVLGLPEPATAGRRRYVEAILAHADTGAAEKTLVGTGDGETAAPDRRITLDAFGPGIQTWPMSEPMSEGAGVVGEPRLAAPDEVADPADPLLVFTEDGDLVPVGSPLPAEAVWTVFPADREPVTDGPVRVVAEGCLPPAWRGWRLVQLALDPAAWLGLDGGPRRAVRGRTRARIIGGAPVPGVTTPDGAAVLGEPPAVWLPGGAGDGWRIEVRPAGGVPPVFGGTVAAPADTEFAALWERAPRPVLGVFTVTVHGPPGRGTRQTVVVAEGLRARYEPSVRPLAPEGLAPAAATLTGPAGLRVTPAAPVFPPTVTGGRVTCLTARAEQMFVLTPPHMRVLAESGPATSAADQVRAGPGGWSGFPLRLALSTLHRTAALRVAVPGRPAPRVLEVVADGCVVQEVTASGGPVAFPGTAGPGRSAGVARFSLKRVLDTVTACGGADLVVRMDGRPVPVAYVRPGGLATGAARRGDRLVLSGAVWVPGLVAWVRSNDEPEGEPVGPLEVAEDCTITLPPGLAGAARLRVRLAIRDPWLPGAPYGDEGSGDTFLVPR
jgi:hypothetical protein